MTEAASRFAQNVAAEQDWTRRESELQVLQSALCARVQELTGKEGSAAKHIQELKEKAARWESAVASGQQNLARAALRYPGCCTHERKA